MTSKEQVLDSLGKEVAQLRGKLGESLASVQQFDVPLEQATTSSFEALKEYSLGAKTANERGIAVGLPHYLRAIQLDPNFAMGYEAVGGGYETEGETQIGRPYYAKAYALREHASEREKLLLTADYYAHVTGEWEKVVEPLQEWVASYPRDRSARGFLGNAYSALGEREKSCEEYRKALPLDPNSSALYNNLAIYLIAAGHFDEARQIIAQAEAKKMDLSGIHQFRYALAFLGGDPGGMAEQLRWFAGKPEENFALSLASDTEAYAGHLVRARELSKQATASALRTDQKENGAVWQENAALREAAYGNRGAASEWAEEGLKLFRGSLGVQVQSALAFAMNGDTAHANSLADELNGRYPLDTHVQSLWLPSIRAQLALDRGNAAQALKDLQPAAPPIEWGLIPFAENVSCLYPTYIRGQAFLASGESPAAAAEFQKILDHGGMVWNCWTGALAQLGVARAIALQSKSARGTERDAARSRAMAAYERFLALWKDADQEIPILIQAKAEYAKLK